VQQPLQAEQVAEGKLQETIVSQAEKLGWIPLEVNRTRGRSTLTYTTPGTPDLFLVGYGRIIAIELKTPEGTLSPAQKKLKLEALRKEVEIHTVRSLDEFLDVHRREGVWRSR